MNLLSIIASVFKLLQWFASFIEGEKNKQAGRDEISAQVNKESADAQERMAKVDDNPSDDAIADSLRHGTFFHGQDHLPDDKAIRQGDTRKDACRIPTFAKWRD